MTSPPAANTPRRNQTFHHEDGYAPSPKAVKGIYNPQVGGIKAFGNAVQGSGALATKLDSSRGICVTNRTMMIAVTAQTTVSSMSVYLSAVNMSSATLPTKSDGGDGGEEEEEVVVVVLSGGRDALSVSPRLQGRSA